MSDPLQKGLSAGQAAYSGISATDLTALKKSVGSGLSAAAAQRQVLDTNAAKQAAGQYPVSGTSAAAYNYLRGQGGYPVNAVPSTQPVNTGIPSGYGGLPAPSGTQLLPARTTPTTTLIQKPYETATNVGPKTQADIFNKGVTDPSKMGKVTQQTVNMPKPSTLNQLLAVAGPMYLGYSALDKFGGLDALSSGYNYLSTMYNTPSAYAAGQAAGDAAFIPNVGGAVSDVAPAAAEDLSYLYENNPYMNAGPAVQVADAGTNAGLAAALDAGVYDASGNLLAPDVGSYFGAGSGGAGGAGTLSDLEVAQAATNAEAAGMDWAAMASEYGPYVAAAIIADQMTGGKIGNAVGDVVQGIGNAAEDVVSGVGDVVSDVGGGIGNAVSSFFGGFGWAEGGQVKGYADGGIPVGAVPFRQTVGTDGFSTPYDAQSLMYQNNPTVAMARGGISAASHLGDYSDGGRLLKGPGDGVSDSIPAMIGGKQPARLADGEFVIPARIVSEIGNGSTEAGARKLYAMMDRVQAARRKTVGKGKVAKNTRADKYLPK